MHASATGSCSHSATDPAIVIPCPDWRKPKRAVETEELVQVGDPIDVKILRVDIEERKIGLSKKQVSDAENSAPAETSSES